jgi:hypothetical protein
MKIAVITACTYASGGPGFAYSEHEVTQAQYDEGEHYEQASAEALDKGYEEPFVHFDENDGPDWLFASHRRDMDEWQARAWEAQNC